MEEPLSSSVIVLLSAVQSHVVASAIAYTMDVKNKIVASAIKFALKFLCHLQPWLAMIMAVKFTDYYSEQFKMYLADPSSTHVFDEIFKEHKLIAVTLALCQEVGLLSLERNTHLFPRCKYPSDENTKTLRISGKITSISTQTIRSFSDKYYKPLAKEDLPDKTIHDLLPELLKQLGFTVAARKRSPATLEITRSMSSWAIAIILQSKAPVPPYTVTREELDSMTGPLPYHNWCIKGMIHNIDPELIRCLEENNRFICTHPVPDRKYSRVRVVHELFAYCRASIEPIDPARLDQLFQDAAAATTHPHHATPADTADTAIAAPTATAAPAAADAPTATAAVDAPVAAMDAAEPNEDTSNLFSNDEDDGGNYDDMAVAYDEAPAQLDSNVGQTQAQSLTAGHHPIGSPADTEGLHPEHSLRDVPTAREGTREEVHIEPHDSSTPERYRTPAPRDASCETMQSQVNQLSTEIAVIKAALMKKKARHARRRSTSSRRTRSPDARRVRGGSVMPTQSPHRGAHHAANRFMEESDVAGDTTTVLLANYNYARLALRQHEQHRAARRNASTH